MKAFSEIVFREAVYLWYYFDLQLRQIFWYWFLGILLGSAVSVFAKGRIHSAAEFLGGHLKGFFSLVLGSALGIASPLCMYGTIPICAAFSKKGVKDDFLASFMMSSILLNPQLILYSAALGKTVLALRIAGCFFCGIIAGIFVRMFFGSGRQQVEKHFFDFSGFAEPENRDVDSNIARRFAKNVFRNVRATGAMFLLGIALSAVFQRYVPQSLVEKLFGKSDGFGVLLASAMGVPLYVCGGGTIPLLKQSLAAGMSLGSVAAFMITGPATKITNLGALKTALGLKHFLLYLAFVWVLSLVLGAEVNVLDHFARQSDYSF